MLGARAYFIAGTDTEIGKTLFSTAFIHALVKQGLQVAGMKPVASGASLLDGQWCNQDVASLLEASNCRLHTDWHNPYLFAPAIAPHLAAQAQACEISLDKIENAYKQLALAADVTVVEGVGGVLVPLNDELDMTHVVQRLDLPVILVVGLRLGCLNHALLSYQALVARGLNVVAWVANQCDANMAEKAANISSLRARLPIPLLASIPYLATVDARVAANFVDLSVLTDVQHQT